MPIDLYSRVDAIEVFDSSNWSFQFGGADEFPEINKRVLSVSCPFFNLDYTSKNCGRKFITGYQPIGDVEITFLEGPRMEVQDFLVAWKESIFESDKLTFKNGGFMNGLLHMYMNDNATPYKTVTFNNMQLTNINDVTFDYSGSAMTVSATFIVTQIGGFSNIGKPQYDNLTTSL